MLLGESSSGAICSAERAFETVTNADHVTQMYQAISNGFNLAAVIFILLWLRFRTKYKMPDYVKILFAMILLTYTLSSIWRLLDVILVYPKG